MSEEELLTVREVARRVGRSEETVRRWIWSGKLPARKIGNQHFVSPGVLDLMQFTKMEPKMIREAQALYDQYGYNPTVEALREHRGQILPTREQQWRDLEDDEVFQDEILRKYGPVDIVRLIHEVREE